MIFLLILLAIVLWVVVLYGAGYMHGGAGDDQYIYDNALAYVGGGYEYRKYAMGTMTLLGINLLGEGKNTVRTHYRTRSCYGNILRGCKGKRHVKVIIKSLGAGHA